MRSYTYNPQVRQVSRAVVLYLPIKAENMVHSATPEFAYRHGGPITRAVLDSMPDEAFNVDRSRHLVIDTRVVMLMPGFITAIPGWHCDAFLRGENGQPSQTEDDPTVKHYTFHYSTTRQSLDGMAGLCPTLFTTRPQTVTYFPEDLDAWWARTDAEVSTAITEGEQGVLTAEDGAVYEFSQGSLHKATPSRERGWRYWFRMSHYQRAPKSEMRNQVNVYTTKGGGW